MENRKEKGPTRKYPPFWERVIPIMLTVLGIIVIGMMMVAVAVVLGIFPGSA